MEKITTIIFDAGGVLFYINNFRNEIMKKVLQSIGYDEKLIEEGLLKLLNFDDEYFLNHSKIVDWSDEKKWLKERYGFLAKNLDKNAKDLSDKLFHLTFDTFQYKLYDETVSVLEKLQKQYKLNVLSNARATLDWAFDLLDIRRYFDNIIISSYEQVEKPDEKIFSLLLERINKKPEECVFIDDKIENIKKAQSMGITSYHLDRSKGMTLLDFENYIKNNKYNL